MTARRRLGGGGGRTARSGLAQRVDAERLPVRLLGRRDDVPDLMAAADVVVSTARWEGQPLGVQEALGLGAAVVATDVGGTREVTGDAAVLVPWPTPRPSRPPSERLLDDPDAARRCARRPAPGRPSSRTWTDTLDQLARVWAAASRRVRRVRPRRRRVEWKPVAERANRLSGRSDNTTRHIFVTGGVASSLGKGLTASSLGRLLRSRGLRVTMQKLDPYLNVDPGHDEPVPAR